MADLNEGRGRDLPRSRARFIAFGVAAAVVFTALAGRLVQLQVVDGAAYARRAASVGTIELPIPAARGLIYDREGRPLAVNVPSWTVKARPADLPGARTGIVLGEVARVIGADSRDLRSRLDAFSGSPYDLVPLARGVHRDAALILGERADQLPGIVVEAEPIRQYLDEDGTVDGSLLSHVVGYLGPVNADELDELTAAGYLPDDAIGRAGVEASYEEELRGTNGAQLVERDAGGRTGAVLDTIREPVPGQSLQLTIDAEMQRTATDALRWGMEAVGVEQGVTIVMNPQTGEILAMVSLPAYDNNKFAGGISAADYQAYLAAEGQPLRNHAIADIYPPGSTFKLVTSIAALEEGVTTAGQRWPTYGCYQIPGAPRGECLFDWNRQGFGPLDITDAFAVSSDTFYYQMAIKLGVDRLGAWAEKLGFGHPTGVRLPGETGGIVASTRWAQSQGRPGVFTGELAQAGIGQNVIAVTPLQLLNAYCTLANGGRLMRPQIVRGTADHQGALVTPAPPEMVAELGASAATMQTMRIGAREVITTGHAYNIRDLRLPGALSGKTGTAEFGEPTSEGTLPFHSWFVAYLPSAPGATDAELAVVTFAYSAVVPGNVSLEVVKYFLQQHYGLDQDLRLDPRDFSLVAAN
ncbi:MAG TPA: penicillin-binding protein 2 [Candidatus Limnocylindria bacterium]|nr:penicillin-binding protein 2 [Candidatus Limnocylindria bacterium]